MATPELHIEPDPKNDQRFLLTVPLNAIPEHMIAKAALSSEHHTSLGAVELLRKQVHQNTKIAAFLLVVDQPIVKQILNSGAKVGIREYQNFRQSCHRRKPMIGVAITFHERDRAALFKLSLPN